MDITIDIMKDSVSEIMDKHFYLATEGKTIDYAWDAPQPAVVNPLSESEAQEWGDAAMKVTMNRVAGDPRRMGTRKVSRVKRISQRTTAAPFHGYVSEPPKARVFSAEEPVGFIAKSLSAAGTLAALAERNTEDPSPIWGVFESMYGTVPPVIKEIVKPDIAKSSEKDIVKFVRSSNHTLYGFNACGPAVSTDTGKYAPETMTKEFMFDWHSMSLSMRFIGEVIARYTGSQRLRDQSIKFAPAYAEARVFRAVNLTTNLVVPTNTEISPAMQQISDTTMRFLTGNVERYGVREMLRAEKRHVTIKSSSGMTVDMVKEIASKLNTVKISLPKNVGVYRPELVVAEINDKTKPRFFETLAKSATKRAHAYIPTWRSVHTSVWRAAFAAGFPGCAKVTSILRRQSVIPNLSEDATKKLLQELAVNMPKGIGFMIYVILNKMMPRSDDVMVEFFSMIKSLSGSDMIELNSSYDAVYNSAVVDSKDPCEVMRAIRVGYTQNQSMAHGFSNINILSGSKGDMIDKLMDALERYVMGRNKFWSDHYNSRVVDNRDLLASLKGIAKGLNLKGFTGLGNTYCLKNTNASFAKGLSDTEILTIQEEIVIAKTNVVKYAFLSQVYKRLKMTLDSTLNMDVYLPANAFRDILLNSCDNYVRKRSTWGDKLATPIGDWPKVRESVERTTRKVDMVKKVDECLNPNIPYTMLLSITTEKISITAKSITRMLRKFLAKSHDQEMVAELDKTDDNDVKAGDSPDPILARASNIAKELEGNPYAALAESDSDDSIDDDNETIETITNVKTKEVASPYAGSAVIGNSILGAKYLAKSDVSLGLNIPEEHSMGWNDAEALSSGSKYLEKENNTIQEKEVTAKDDIFAATLELSGTMDFGLDFGFGDEDGGASFNYDKFSFKEWLLTNNLADYDYSSFLKFVRFERNSQMINIEENDLSVETGKLEQVYADYMSSMNEALPADYRDDEGEDDEIDIL